MKTSRTKIIRGLVFGVAMIAGAAVATRGLSAAPTASAKAGPVKDSVCKLLGCANGPRSCADATGGFELPEVGKIEVVWHCYEAEIGRPVT